MGGSRDEAFFDLTGNVEALIVEVLGLLLCMGRVVARCAGKITGVFAMNQVFRMVCVGACAVGVGMIGGCGGGGDAEHGDAAPAPAAAAKPSFNAMAVKGALVYKKTCAACHGADAKGMPNNGPDLTDSAFVRDTNDADLLQYVIHGREVPGGVPMPPRGGFTEDVLPDADIEKVIAYLRNFPANKP